MPTIQIELNKATKIVEEIEKDTVRSIACLSIWQRANGKDDIKERYDHTFEAHAFSMIHDSLHISLVMTLLRMYDTDKRSASIPNLIKCLNSDELISELKKHTTAQRNRINNWKEELLKKYSLILHDGTLRSLKLLRNHTIAHIDQNNSTSHGAKYGQEEELLKRTLPISRLLLLIVKSEDVDFYDYDETWKKYSNAFWKSAAKSPKIQTI